MPASAASSKNPQRVRAILYCRISSDPREKRAGVGRQETEGRALCAQLSNDREVWDVARVVVDNDRSNSILRKREREQFDALLADLEDGKLDGDAIVFFDQDRFVKDELDWARWLRALRRYPVRVAIVGSGEVDVASPDGYMMSAFRMMTANVATMQQAKRIRSFTKAQFAAGKTSGQVAYGWRRVIETNSAGYKVGWHDEIFPEQAEVVREIVRRILAGESLRKIASDLNERGLATPSRKRDCQGKPWTPLAVRQIAERALNAGIRVEDDGAETKLVLPPLVSRADWTRCMALLKDPARRVNQHTNTTTLLSSLARCAECGEKVRRRLNSQHATKYRPNNARKPKVAGYGCNTGCVQIQQEVCDEKVTAYIVEFLSLVDPSDLLDNGRDDAAAQAGRELEALEADLAAYQAMAKLPIGNPARLTAAAFAELLASLTPQIAAARKRASVTVSPGAVLAYDVARSGGVEATWGALGLEQQRAIVEALVDVKIRKRTPGRNPHLGPDPERCQVTRKAAAE